MKIIFTIIFSILFCGFIYSQTDFNFNDYKFRYQKYKGLDFGFNLKEGNQNNETTFGVRKKTIGLDLTASVNYFSYLNTDRKQQFTTISLSANPSFNSNLNGKSNNLYSHFQFNSLQRNYFNEKAFYGYEFNLSENYYAYNSNKDQNLSNFLDPEIAFLAGKGRSEYISDGISAIRLFDELKSKKILTREISNDDIIAFSNIIIKYNNTRILDDRINRIAMIEAMVNYLKENKLAGECNASMFAILNDQVYFAIHTIRYCGFVKQVGIGASFYDHTSNRKTDSSRFEITTNNFTPLVKFSVINYKPIDIKNQVNSGIEIGAYYNNDKFYNLSENDTLIKSTSIRQKPQLNLSAFIERGYYPTTRTAITWNNTLMVSALKILQPSFTDGLNISTAFKSSLSLYYYISPQFRLSISENLTVSNTTQLRANFLPTNLSNVINNFNAVLTYALF